MFERFDVLAISRRNTFTGCGHHKGIVRKCGTHQSQTNEDRKAYFYDHVFFTLNRLYFKPIGKFKEYQTYEAVLAVKI